MIGINKKAIIILVLVFFHGLSLAETKPQDISLIITELKNNRSAIKNLIDSIEQNTKTIKEGNDFYENKSNSYETIISINTKLLKENLEQLKQYNIFPTKLNDINKELSEINKNTTKDWSFLITLLLSIFAVLVAFVTLCFTMRTWKKSFRPIISAMIRTIDHRETIRSFKLELLNTGLIPAKNVKLIANYSDLQDCLDKSVTESFFNTILKCFNNDTVILSMHQNCPFKCHFGHCSTESSKFWIYGKEFSIKIKYQDFFRKNYEQILKIKIMDSTNFTDQHLSIEINGEKLKVPL